MLPMRCIQPPCMNIEVNTVGQRDALLTMGCPIEEIDLATTYDAIGDLFEKCGNCGATRHSMLPTCQTCGDTTAEVETT